MAQKIESFRDLIAWQKSMDLVDAIYTLTRAFPRQEMFGLVSQMQRAAVSVPSNLAEGYARRRTGDYIRFVDVSRGSLAELQTQAIISKRQGYITQADLDKLWPMLDEAARILYGLSEALQRKTAVRLVSFIGLACAVPVLLRYLFPLIC